MRSRFLLLAGAALAVSLVASACGGGEVGTGPQPGAEDEEITVCMMPKLVGIPYFNASEQGAEEAAEELGITLEHNGPSEALASRQVEMIEQWIQQGTCDAITVAANDPDALAPAMNSAADAAINTGAWDADVAEDAREVFVNQATFEAIGQTLVEVMAKQTGDKGDFLVITGSLTAPNQNSWMEEMRNHMEEKFPDMSIAEVLPGEEDYQKGVDLTRDYLRANPNTAGVFGITSVALPGAAEAVEQLGVDVPVTGLSTPNEMKPFVERGTVKEFVLWNPVDLGYLAVHTAVKQVQDDLELQQGFTFEAGRLGEVEFIEDDVVLLGPPVVFNSDNIDQFDF